TRPAGLPRVSFDVLGRPRQEEAQHLGRRVRARRIGEAAARRRVDASCCQGRQLLKKTCPAKGDAATGGESSESVSCGVTPSAPRERPRYPGNCERADRLASWSVGPSMRKGSTQVSNSAALIACTANAASRRSMLWA